MMELALDILDIPDDFDDANERLYRLGMTDGLPVVPPTRARVEAMLGGTARVPDESLGDFPPAFNETSVAMVAVNAVMAGCIPAYLPTVLAAIEAILEPQFNLYGINATTHPVSPLLIVNGPVVQELKLNSGYNVFGQGWRANATIGRAVRLAMLNIGGGRPGEGDRATHGHPGKYSYCIAENEPRNPWIPLHVQRGFEPGDSTVTVFGAESPHEVNDHTSGSGAGVLSVAADVFATLGNNNAYFNDGELCLVMAPEHADRVARDGWTLPAIRQYLFARARNTVGRLRAVGKLDKLINKSVNLADDGDLVPMVRGPDDILIVVAGGAGQHAMAIPSFGMTRAVTRRIALH